jgi:hypothetical protein
VVLFGSWVFLAVLFLGLGLRYFLIGFIFRFTWKIFSVIPFALDRRGYATNGDGG